MIYLVCATLHKLPEADFSNVRKVNSTLERYNAAKNNDTSSFCEITKTSEAKQTSKIDTTKEQRGSQTNGEGHIWSPAPQRV